MVHPSKTLTLGRLQASLVCSRLIAFFMVSDLLDQLHRVADSRSRSPPKLGGVRGGLNRRLCSLWYPLISDAKILIISMQNKLFSNLFQICFVLKILNV